MASSQLPESDVLYSPQGSERERNTSQAEPRVACPASHGEQIPWGPSRRLGVSDAPERQESPLPVYDSFEAQTPPPRMRKFGVSEKSPGAARQEPNAAAPVPPVAQMPQLRVRGFGATSKPPPEEPKVRRDRVASIDLQPLKDLRSALSYYKIAVDGYFGSKVYFLQWDTFDTFLKSKDVTMVLFYKSDDKKMRTLQKEYAVAAHCTKRENHGYASVNCLAESDLCDVNDYKRGALLKVYSGTNVVGTFEDPYSLKADTIRQYVELSPIFKKSRYPEVKSPEWPWV